jgi:mannose-P-dolichol utilization defect protein 1
MTTTYLVGLLSLLSLATLALAQPTGTKEFKFFFFREDCFDLFFNKFDFFSNKECLKITFSKGIGFAIVAGAFVLKVPQILKILKAKSVEGISKYLFYTEILMLINSSGYSIQANIPFSVYGESLIILVQNFLIVLLFWVYSKDITTLEKLLLFLFFSGYSFVLFSGSAFLTADHWNLIQKSNLGLSLLSRVPQIITNFANKSTGQLAFFTFLLSFLGVVARLGTVLIETDDFMYQLQYILSTVLNGIIVA